MPARCRKERPVTGRLLCYRKPSTMPSGLNKVMLIGNLGRDAETRHTPSGTAVTNFTLATTRRVKDAQTGEWGDKTDWHNVVLWRGENVAPYLTRGKKVYVEGRLQTRSWEGQDGQKRYMTEVVCDPFGLILLGGREGGGQGGRASGGGGYSQPAGGGQPASSQPVAASGGGGEASQPARTSQPTSDSGGGEADDIPF